MNYDELLRTPQWAQKRNKILERDHYKCKCCGRKDFLQVHHRQYHTVKATGEKKAPWAYEDKYLVTLCNTCHLNGHMKYRVPYFII